MSKKDMALMKIGFMIGVVVKNLSREERSDVYQTILRHIPKDELYKYVTRDREGEPAEWVV